MYYLLPEHHNEMETKDWEWVAPPHRKATIMSTMRIASV